MSFFQFLGIIRHRIISIVGAGVAAAVISTIITGLLPVRYESTIALDITRVNREQTADYQYDGYYAIQASELFADTAISWLQTPAVINMIYDTSGVTPMKSSLPFLRQFKTKKLSSQGIQVRFSAASEKDARAVTSAVVSVLSQKGEDALLTSEKKNAFQITSEEPVIGQRHFDAATVAFAGFATGIVLGMLWAMGRRYHEAKN